MTSLGLTKMYVARNSLSVISIEQRQSNDQTIKARICIATYSAADTYHQAQTIKKGPSAI